MQTKYWYCNCTSSQPGFDCQAQITLLSDPDCWFPLCFHFIWSPYKTINSNTAQPAICVSISLKEVIFITYFFLSYPLLSSLESSQWLNIYMLFTFDLLYFLILFTFVKGFFFFFKNPYKLLHCWHMLNTSYQCKEREWCCSLWFIINSSSDFSFSL